MSKDHDRVGVPTVESVEHKYDKTSQSITWDVMKQLCFGNKTVEV
jgi:hypothetical protein